jgi:hypothetical protein
MFIATAAVCTLLATLLALSALRKLSHRPEVVQGYARVGVPEPALFRGRPRTSQGRHRLNGDSHVGLGGAGTAGGGAGRPNPGGVRPSAGF